MKHTNSIQQVITSAIDASVKLGCIIDVDARKSAVKQALALGFDKQAIKNACMVRIDRKFKRIGYSVSKPTTHVERLRYIRAVAMLPVVSDNAEADALGLNYGDWSRYSRLCSNGYEWVIIAPDEPANDWYTNDAITVSYLRKKYGA